MMLIDQQFWQRIGNGAKSTHNEIEHGIENITGIVIKLILHSEVRCCVEQESEQP